MNIFVSLAVSLALTLVLELGFALLWGAGKRDLPLVALANVLTNPVVVLCHTLAALFFPAALPPVTFALEAGAVLAEGRLFATRGGIRFPCGFSLCANVFSFSVGLLI